MDTLKITGSVGSKNRTKFNHVKLYNKNIFEFSLDKKNIGCPLMHSVNYDQPETGKD